MKTRWTSLSVLLLLTACGSSETPSDAACGVTDAAADPHTAAREACMYGSGARAADTLGDLSAARRAITHVVVMMQENRSFDHMFGTFGHGTDGTPPGYSNPDTGGRPVAPYHLNAPCSADPPHQWDTAHDEWNMGRMDGFMRVGGMPAMGYYDPPDHPFYTWMFQTFATSDRYFASVLGGTWPNRDYLYAGTADGVRITLVGIPHVRNVFDALTDAHVTWGEYVNGDPFEGSLGWTSDHPGVHTFEEFHAAARAGTLPSVVFLDAGDTLDEHPPSNVHDGEAYTRAVVQSLFASPLWAHTAFFLTYDEYGGFFDHLPPPAACVAADNERDVDHLGFRVPVFVVSPYARRGYISHSTHSHTSILRFIEAVYDLPAFTRRDANSDAMLDMFDFSCPAFTTPPAPVPAAAAGGC